MTRKHFLSAIAAVCAVALSAAPAAAKPDFSGNWKLVLDKSDFGPMPAPEKMEYAIDHKDPEFSAKVSQSSPQGEVQVDIKYNTEGKETGNKLRGTAFKTPRTRDETKLTTTSKLTLQRNHI